MATTIQTVAGVGQFDGTAGAGLFSFAQWDAVPRTTRVVVTLASYAAVTGGNPGDLLEFYFRRPGGAATERALLLRADGTEIAGPAGDGDVTICGRVVPRDPGDSGQHWELVAFTTGKTVTASVCVDVVLEPFPDAVAP